MGKDIGSGNYSDEDLINFKERLKAETNLLKSWFDTNSFVRDFPKTGIELEAWILDENMLPDPYAPEFLAKLNNEKIVPEIAKFNFEMNSDPHPLGGNVFSTLEKELQEMWSQCEKVANENNKHPLLVGTMPLLRPHMLSMDYLSPQNRYAVMNKQVMKMRDGNCLLYTSPSPRDGLLSRMPSSA